MRKIIKLSVFALTLVLIIQLFSLMHDKQILKEKLIRLHVIANSDSETDQNMKLKVKDKVVSWLEPQMSHCLSKEEAGTFLKENLDAIKAVAAAELARLGCDYPVTVSLSERAFDMRVYDTFSLPSGIYDALCVDIGAAEGKNWWCVAFPTLCIPASASEFVETAADGGIAESLSSELLNTGEFRIRFYLLEQLGRLENFLRGKK